MKIKLLILFIVLSVFLFSCESKDKWINQYDGNVDEAEIQKICQSKNAECGAINTNYQGSSFDVNCGKCTDGYECNDDNKCQDINECAQSELNKCHENTVCANEEGTYSCICKENYSGDDCVPDTRLKDCEGLPENATWNTASNIEQTWNGSNWTPSNKGSFNEEVTETECYFKCMKHFTWNGSKCEADTNTVECTGLPENAQWNSVSEITQTWNGNDWQPSNKGNYNEKASTNECRYICKANYEWKDSECVAATRTEKCTDLPDGAVWNTVSEIKQTWDGSNWQPDTNGKYNEKASTNECRYICKTNYEWKDSECVAATQEAKCPAKPANTVWNDNGANGKFIQTWDGSAWSPAVDSSVYSTTADVCHYICEPDYHFENNQCAFNTKIAECSAKPENSSWNDNGAYGTFTQTWIGNTWNPANYPSTYNKTAGTCVFVCNSGYIWENLSCEIAPTQQANCSSKPVNTVWNDNGANGRFTQTYDGSVWEPANYPASYSETAGTCRYKCAEHYTWNSLTLKCDADTQPANCSAKPANTVWNDSGENGKFTQTWTGSGWDPTSYTSTYNTTAGVCRYKCDSTHTWENGNCINQKTSNCTGLPAEHASWNTVSSITQNWSSSNGWQPSTAGVFNETPSTNRCYFKCDEHYTWNASTSKCEPATQKADCSSKPANTVWNDNGANGKFTQTWTGSGWNPTSYTSTYNTTAGVCRYKCDSTHTWENGNCINQKTSNCTGLPAEHASWNTVSSITQNWSSSNGWQPSTAGVFNETPSTNRCYFKCDEHYTWNASTSKCEPATNPANCTGLPAEHASWNTVSSITQTWNGYGWSPSATGVFNETPSTSQCHFKCDLGYHWENPVCVSNTKTNVSCIGLPAEHASWNTVSSITQTWNGIEWTPSSAGTYNPNASESECRFKCDENYYWNGETCGDAQTQEADCTGLPDGAQWNIASRIFQTWDNYLGIWVPSSTGSYNTEASTTQCRYICKENYTWNGSICKANTIVSECTDLPNDAEWTSVSRITQTWNGKIWSPSTVGTYNTQGNSNYCYFKCKDQYGWNTNGHFCQKLSLANICTGKDTCYDNESTIDCTSSSYFGQDAYYAQAGTCYPKNFSSSAYTVTDNNLGLEWQKTISESTYTWSDAVAYCENLNYAGYDDWRLPELQELLSIVDLGREKPSINTYYFPNVTSKYFWSISTKGSYAWYVNFSNGTYSNTSSASANVICVRSEETLPKSDFTLLQKNWARLVKDNTSGLIWMTSSSNSSSSWAGALSYCENSTYAGYSDWRLPNKNELVSIVNFGKSSPASDFPDMPEDIFWTSTPIRIVEESGCDGDYLYLDVSAISFSNGSDTSFSDSNNYNYALCVRTDSCPKGYIMNNGSCELEETQTANCTNRPANAVWNSVSYIKQTRIGSTWYPTSQASYNETPSVYECRFKCATNYFWNGSACVNPCTNHNCGSIDHSTGQCYGTASDKYYCGCNSGYFWSGSNCINPCENNPCSSIAHSDNICTGTAYNNYSCGCRSGYSWNSGSCQQYSKLSIGNICTNQKTCYNTSSSITCPTSSSSSFFGQDAYYASQEYCIPQSLTLTTVSEKQVVVDSNTGLTWIQSPSSSTYTWNNAGNYCTSLSNSTYAGYADWRVPTPLEFLTIVDNSKYNLATNANFTGMPTSTTAYLWTSKEYPDDTTQAYYFIPYYGSIGYSVAKTSSYKSICVRGTTMATGSFTSKTVNSKVVVTDSTTGLMWQKEYATNKTWQTALKYCEDSTYAGYSDWRLPNKNELASLLKNPSLDSNNVAQYSTFPDMPKAYFWSSSTYMSSSSSAWLIGFNNGFIGNATKTTSSYNVRCVR